MTEPDPTTEPDAAPLPSIEEPMADLGHEGIRVAVVGAIAQVTATIDQLRADFTAAQQQLLGAQNALAPLIEQVTFLGAAVQSLNARVGALEPAPWPHAPNPTPEPDPTT